MSLMMFGPMKVPRLNLRFCPTCPRRPLSELRQLSLEGCRCMPQLDAGLAAAAPALRRLTALSLQGCSSLSDSGLAALGCLASLASLNLSECPGISGQGVEAWSLPSLTCLQLQNCPGLDDAGAAALARLAALRSLNLRQCKRVGDEGLAALAPALRRLTSLSLQVGGLLRCRVHGPAGLPNPFLAAPA